MDAREFDFGEIGDNSGSQRWYRCLRVYFRYWSEVSLSTEDLYVANTTSQAARAAAGHACLAVGVTPSIEAMGDLPKMVDANRLQ